ncbi:NUDIX hydrolase [Aureimonas endophytica]|uniref:NUDIX hydrolase n=1 Tax=Aureimonas endophytica TaxID=2027858 RepID=A0A916ZPQ7_9HYPH|nr:NUDIX hydrolase [Aureimonas endophytica]
MAALPLRLSEAGRPELLVVTSRETRRWIVPKGWPMKGLKDHKAAAIEALEEAGVRGTMLRRAAGHYSYWRRTRTDFRLTDVVAYALKVETVLAEWKEREQREARWANLLDAADLVADPELSTLIVRLPLDAKVMKFLGWKMPG